MNTNLNEAKALAPSDGLGVNRLGNAILCYAWGESDRPEARIAKSAEEVRQFLITEAFGDDKDETLGEWMQELAVWDWREDGQLRWEFEIGGVWLEDIVDENTRAPQPKATTLIEVLERASAAIWDAHYGNGIAVAYARNVTGEITAVLKILKGTE